MLEMDSLRAYTIGCILYKYNICALVGSMWNNEMQTDGPDGEY